MEKIHKSIKILFFHPGVWAASIAFFLIIAGVVGVKQSLAMLLQTKDTVTQKVQLASVPSPTPAPSPTPMQAGPTATPTVVYIPTPTIIKVVTPIITAVPIQHPIADPTDDAVWERLAACESNGHWADDTGNGYFGGLQFSQSAWESVGGVGKPSDASRDEQIAKGKLLQARRGWGPWGGCSRILGLN